MRCFLFFFFPARDITILITNYLNHRSKHKYRQMVCHPFESALSPTILLSNQRNLRLVLYIYTTGFVIFCALRMNFYDYCVSRDQNRRTCVYS